MAYEWEKEVARRTALIRSLPGEYIEPLLNQSRFRSYDRGETVFIQDDTATGIHVVLGGWVKLYRVAPNGAEAVVSVFARGESFGEAVALRGRPYPVSAEAVTPSKLMLVPTSVLLRMMHENPEIGVSLLASTFAHLHSLVEQLGQLKAETGAQRVADFLLGLCTAEQGGCVVDLPYDKVLIAGRLGMKPESLSRAFARLKEAGVRIRKNSAEIEDIDRLRNYVEADPAQAWTKR